MNCSGDVSWHKGRVFISEVFRNEDLGFEQMEEDLYRVTFHNMELRHSTARRCASVQCCVLIVNDKPWKCQAMESMESHGAGFHPSTLEILRDSHIPTGLTTTGIL